MHLLITAGGTREYIDPVRFITNASSGQMGYALARAALKAGHKATLITTPVDRQPPKEAKIVKVETTAQMFKAVQQQFSRCDCLIMTAAVADYTPVKQAKSKIKKTNKSLTIKLKHTVDILKWAGNNKRNGQVVIGFALEDKDIKANAESKLLEKKLDIVVANKPGAIGSSRSTVYIKSVDKPWVEIVDKSKTVTARRIIAMAEAIGK